LCLLVTASQHCLSIWISIINTDKINVTYVAQSLERQSTIGRFINTATIVDT